MNIVYYKGHDYFDYMKYYNPNDINIFIGGRCTGKTFSILHYRGICEVEEFEYKVGGSGTKYFFTSLYEKRNVSSVRTTIYEVANWSSLYFYSHGGFSISKTGGISA